MEERRNVRKSRWTYRSLLVLLHLVYLNIHLGHFSKYWTHCSTCHIF